MHRLSVLIAGAVLIVLAALVLRGHEPTLILIAIAWFAVWGLARWRADSAGDGTGARRSRRAGAPDRGDGSVADGSAAYDTAGIGGGAGGYGGTTPAHGHGHGGAHGHGHGDHGHGDGGHGGDGGGDAGGDGGGGGDGGS